MFVNVMGTKYTITKKNHEDDPYFDANSCNGYCDFNTKQIVVCKLNTYPSAVYKADSFYENGEKRILRHEIVHAFLYESGLDTNAYSCYGGWPRNEEMVDWFAIQGPKIYDAWVKAKAI